VCWNGDGDGCGLGSRIEADENRGWLYEYDFIDGVEYMGEETLEKIEMCSTKLPLLAGLRPTSPRSTSKG